jgi:hypothetical protein
LSGIQFHAAASTPITNQHFSPVVWQQADRLGWPGGSRVELFATMLKEFNIVGMKRKDIELLIGSPKDECYRLGYSCATCIKVRFQYQDNLLQKWRLESIGFYSKDGWQPEKWIDKNILLTLKVPLVPVEITEKHTETISN